MTALHCLHDALCLLCLVCGLPTSCHWPTCRMNATFAILSVAMSSVWLSLIAGEVVALLEALGHIWGFDTVRGHRWVAMQSLVLQQALRGARHLVGRHLPSGHPAIHSVPSTQRLSGQGEEAPACRCAAPQGQSQCYSAYQPATRCARWQRAACCSPC